MCSFPIKQPHYDPRSAVTPGDAEQDAESAARRAKIIIRAVDTAADLRKVADLFSRIWDAPLVPPMPHDIMRSLVHAEGRVHAAYREGQLRGATVAVFGPPADALCYSLIAGVSPEAEGQGVGLALKLAQRAWALQTGAARMRWTFDPLLRHNARFNISRLGAVGTDYLVDFYGELADGVNDPETDRLAVTWDLRVALPGSAHPSERPGAPEITDEDEAPAILVGGPGGEPVAGTVPRAGGGGPSRLRCWIPGDILTIRRTDPALARRWRLAVREALGGAVGNGYQVTGVMDPGSYVLEKAQARR
jgi:predicted GNAT superfamily acetyltransferase